MSKSPFEEQVTTVSGSPGSVQVASFPTPNSPDPRASQFSSAAPTAVGSPREVTQFGGAVELDF